MKPTAQIILDSETDKEDKRDRLIELGLEPTVQNAILLGLSEKAIEGNASAIKSFRELAVEEQERNSLPEGPELAALTDDELRALAERLRERAEGGEDGRGIFDRDGTRQT